MAKDSELKPELNTELNTEAEAEAKDAEQNIPPVIVHDGLEGMPVFRVFTKKGCSRCALVERTLRENGVEYTPMDVDIPENKALARQMLIQTAGQIIDMNNNKITLQEALKLHAERTAQTAPGQQ